MVQIVDAQFSTMFRLFNLDILNICTLDTRYFTGFGVHIEIGVVIIEKCYNGASDHQNLLQICFKDRQLPHGDYII